MKALAAACAALGICARVAAAQTPTVPVPRDTVRPAPSDSAVRDSVVSRLLDQDSASTVRPAAFSLLGLDRLRLRSLGATVGIVRPGQAVSTRIYSVHADYGEVWHGVRLVFASSYWATRYRDDAVARFAEAVRDVVRDPSRDDSVQIGHVRLSDLSVAADARWQPGVSARPSALARGVRPWVGGGLAAHFINVEGAPVSGTFLERALDSAAIGLTTALGLDLTPIPNFQLTMQGRYDFLSTVRYASVRGGASFIFGPAGAR